MQTKTEQPEIEQTEVETENEGHSQAELEAFEKSLEGLDNENDPNHDPEEQKQAEQAKQAEEAQSKEAANDACKFAAFMAMETIESALQGMVHERFKFDDKSKERAVEAYAPLIVKYGDTVGNLISEWGVEFKAGVFTAGLVMSSLGQVKRLRKEDEQADKADSSKVQTETEQMQETA